MSTMTNLNIRVDADTKQKAEELFSDLGFTLSAAVNVFLKQAISRNGMPFPVVRADPFYSESNQRALRRAIEQLETGGGTAHELVPDDE
jgi:DNA-damage-inducible protein J